MDEQLLNAYSLWDPEVASEVNSRLPQNFRRGKKIDKDGYLQDIEGVYHAIGGHARLAHEANQDPKWFYNRFLPRILPDEKQELDLTVHIHPALPRSPLDGEFVEVKPDESNQRELSDLRGGAKLPSDDSGLRAPSQLDQDSHQAPRSPPPGAWCTGGPEDSLEQDGSRSPFE